MAVYEAIRNLVQYGVNTGLLQESDRIYATNQILEVLGLDEYEEPQGACREISLEETLDALLDYAHETGVLKEDGVVYRDLFDTKLMNCLMPRPSEVIGHFWKLYEESPEAATNYYYKLSQDSNYIRRYRVSKDMKWKTDTKYGELDITVNLSKPEKDPKAIAAAKLAKQSGYPKCLLCKENEGYAGRVNHPARNNHRIIPITVNDSQWGFQYSPYVYYNEHCIVFNGVHTPMKIERATFVKLFDFVKLFPHYFLGSNADLPIVGGSILSHDHFQGGHYTFAMAKAPIEQKFEMEGFEDVEAGIVKWPMSVLRTRSKNPDRLIDLGEKVLRAWRSYTDEDAFIYAETDGEPHNTITPIARKNGDFYELDLVLRNNITTDEYPLGVYHPHAKLHHIKKENIGLIEVMGLAVLPSRLKQELADLAEAILSGGDIRSNPELEKHADWVDEFLPKYEHITSENINEILQKEVGLVFEQVLEDAGVYKCTPEGSRHLPGSCAQWASDKEEIMERDLFLRKYRIEQEDFDAAGVSWEELTAIADHYATIEGKLREIGKDFVDKYLYDIEKAGIHSYRYRTKAPGHLLEKIIRKKKEQPEKFAQLGVDNYWKYVTDLIGIRVFFLYREDWRHFHEYITSAFENAPEQYVKDRERDFDNDETHCYIAERPKVYRRNGDSRIYDENVIEIKSGGIYRSLHYIIKYRGYYVEIQARTLFEEGWSEVDHDIVYPYHKDDVMLRDFSRLLNRLSGMADEMSSYFRRMKVEKEFEEVLLGEYKEDKEAKLLTSMRELLGKEER